MSRHKSPKKIVVFVIIVITIFLIYRFDLLQYLNLGFIKSKQADFNIFYSQNPVLTVLVFFLLYITVTGLSLPSATVLTILSGALFGFIKGLIIVSFASAIGATIAFMISRYLFRDYFQEKYGSKLSIINDGVKKEGNFYLFAMRLVPLFPFFLINALMALTPINIANFFLVSQIGMLPGTAVYVFAGTKLAEVESLSGILSPDLIFAFALLGIFPIITKKLLGFVRSGKVLAQYKKPKSYDYNVIVIGAGSGGLVAAYVAAALKARVALIEKNKMGGDCLNTGCVPSKTLIQSAKVVHYIKNSEKYGLKAASVDFDFSDVMERVQEKIKKIAPHDSVERYEKLGVECIEGEAKIIDPYRIKAGEREFTTRSIIVATGASPLVPKIPGIEKIDYVTSDTVWGLREKPENFLIIGGGAIGCEFAQTMARLGSKITLVEGAPHIMGREDTEVSEFVRNKFESEGIRVLTGFLANEFGREGDKNFLIARSEDREEKIYFDKVLIALGRKAESRGFGLEELGVELRKNGTVEADKFLRTNFPNIFVCGDITGPFQFTHTASFQAGYAAINALFSPLAKLSVNYNVIPWCTFTDPEVARVGLNEKEAEDRGIDYEVTKYGIDDLDRAIADNSDYGFVKVITPKGRDKILGVTIVGVHAGDLLTEFVFAMNNGLGLGKIFNTIHTYPTLSEANKFTAGVWKRAHSPKKLLEFLEKLHNFRRGK